MKRKHKQYSKPKRPFDKFRIDEEAEVKKQFGLKNKKEIWKAESQIKSIREKAKRLISKNKEEQETFFKILRKMGFEVDSIGDVLSLEKKDYLSRRLQTILHKKRLAPTVKSARQLIVHKKVLVDGQIVNVPSYIVPKELEDKIEIKGKKPKKKQETSKDEISNEEKDKSEKEENEDETKEKGEKNNG